MITKYNRAKLAAIYFSLRIVIVSRKKSCFFSIFIKLRDLWPFVVYIRSVASTVGNNSFSKIT